MDYLEKLDLLNRIRDRVNDENLRSILTDMVKLIDRAFETARCHIHED